MPYRCLAAAIVIHATAQANTDDPVPERLTVTGKQPFYQQNLAEILPSSVVTPDNLLSSAQLADIVAQDQNVTLNGQGGQLQVFNIRGFSRWRVQTLIEGVPIWTDRRAGSAAEFVPPVFIQSAHVLAGAASSQLGSGAIGGGVDFALRQPQSAELRARFGSNQSNRELAYFDHNDNTDWLISSRSAANSEDGNGNLLLDQFEQHAGFVRHRFHDSALQEAWVLYSEGNNLGKSSSDFPNDRITLYPTNDHWVGKLSFDVGGAEAAVFAHKQRLDTVIERPAERINVSRNDSVDYGFYLGNEQELQGWQWRWRLQGNGRNDVEALEDEFGADGALAFSQVNLDGRQNEIAGLVDAAKDFGAWSLALGGRVAYQTLDSQQQDFSDTNFSAFIGASLPLAEHWQLSGYYSTAYRTPSLTELFFNGETPRGLVIGDPTLQTEQANNINLRINYAVADFSLQVQGFYQQIDDYIERLEVQRDVLQFVNLDQADIRGFNYQWQWQATESLRVSLNGQVVDGEDEQGTPIADISPDEHRLNLRYQQGAWQLSSDLRYRHRKGDIGSGEQPLNSVLIWNLGASTQLSRQWQLNLSANNLFDRVFLTTTDDRAPLAQGRDVQVEFIYRL